MKKKVKFTDSNLLNENISVLLCDIGNIFGFRTKRDI